MVIYVVQDLKFTGLTRQIIGGKVESHLMKNSMEINVEINRRRPDIARVSRILVRGDVLSW